MIVMVIWSFALRKEAIYNASNKYIHCTIYLFNIAKQENKETKVEQATNSSFQ